MNYRRVLLLTGLEGAVEVAKTIRHVAPDAELLLIVARLPAANVAWLSTEAPAELNEAATARLEALQTAASGLARTVEVRIESEAAADDLAALAASAKADLIVTDALPDIAQLRKLTSLPVLWVAEGCSIDSPISHLLCVALGDRARRSVAAFLRDHAKAAMRVSVMTAWSGDSATAFGVAGITAHVDFISPAQQEAGDLIVLARFPGVLLATREWSAPILILPPLPTTFRAVRAMDVADVVNDHGVIRLAAHYATGVGRHDPIPDQALSIVSGGRVVANVITRDGTAELPLDFDAGAFGIYRSDAARSHDPLLSIENDAAVLRPRSAPLVLFDANLEADDLQMLSSAEGFDLLAVRMRPVNSCASIRKRLLKAGLAPHVVDARAVLDEGSALDVDEAVDGVRLARVAARMRGAGYPVAAIIQLGKHAPSTIDFETTTAEEIRSNPPTFRPHSRGRLEATTGAPLIEGNGIEVELDNAKGHRWLLDAIASAKERVHFQTYMALDDDVGRSVEAALAAAGARGVMVRVVVDSLHGLHGSYSAHNPLLDRLAVRPGIELRTGRPLTGLPSLEDLKQRDHRKLAIVDGTVALVGGRNLSHEYYAGFDEVHLSSSSLWREVPWLDAGARVEGPAVATLEASFLDSWQAAGGPPFDIIERPHAGSVAAHVVIHHGLRDARTLEAYLAMIDSAQSHVYTVNGFPLVLEIQHALLRACRRGVRVRTLVGSLTPKHDGRPFRGPWSTARLEATELVHSRMDDLVAAGAEAYQFVIPEQRSWERGIGSIEPHVHAKVMSVDGRICSVGSANLDVTAGYWEDELVLIVENEAITASLESHIDALMSGSRRVDRHDPEWQKTARRRNWMRHWPGVLSV